MDHGSWGGGGGGGGGVQITIVTFCLWDKQAAIMEIPAVVIG